MDKRIKFRHLDAFSAICRNRSLKRAGEELGLTQPAVSKTLKELEDILGTVLLERSRSGVAMTAEGEVFLQFAEQSSAAIRQGIRSVQAKSPRIGRLRIGALPSVADALLPRAVQRFTARAPDVTLEVREAPHRSLTNLLRSGDLDIVVGRLGVAETMEGLAFHQLFIEEVVVVASPESPALKEKSFAALSQYRILYPPQDSAIRPLVARLLMAQGVPLYANRIESASAAFGRAMLLEDPGAVWFISRGVVARDLAEGRLCALGLDTEVTQGAVGAMTRRDEVMAPAARSFLNSLSDVIT